MPPQPERSPQNKRLDPVSKFREEYATALHDAEVSAEHTATEGWANVYAGQRKTEREGRRALADALRNVADRLEVRELDEDEIKEIGEAKKACAELADRSAAFEQQAVSPVREPVERCQRIIDEAVSLARMEEERHPLVQTGLTHLMEAAVAEIRRPKWEGEAGRVVIV